ncbi:MAG: hypothetical protein ABIH79_00350 [archaeon]
MDAIRLLNEISLRKLWLTILNHFVWENLKMLNKSVEKGILFVLIIMFCLSFVVAEDSWESFDGGNNSSVDIVENLSKGGDEIVNGEDEFFEDSKLRDSSFENLNSLGYTEYFYIALGVGVIGLLILIFFAYLFFKRPKNRWEK